MLIKNIVIQKLNGYKILFYEFNICHYTYIFLTNYAVFSVTYLQFVFFYYSLLVNYGLY